jgi:hypothetical protein
MEVDSAEADGIKWECQSAWVWKLRPSPILPRCRTVQELSTTASCNQQSDPESNFGPVQIHKAPPEAPAIFLGQQDTMTNNREIYPLQDQTTKVAPEALNFFLIGG